MHLQAGCFPNPDRFLRVELRSGGEWSFERMHRFVDELHKVAFELATGSVHDRIAAALLIGSSLPLPLSLIFFFFPSNFPFNHTCTYI